MEQMKCKQTFKIFILEEKYGNLIIEMLLVGFSSYEWWQRSWCCNINFQVWKLSSLRCLLCYNSHMHVPNSNTKKRKWLITYYKTYGIMALKKTMLIWIML